MHTVIGAFDSRQHAHHALDRLRDAGFPRDCMYLRTAEAPDDVSGQAGADAADESHGFFHTLSHLFAGLFGTAGDAGEYAETIRRGGTVVVVDAADEATAQKAHAVLQRLDGLVDMDERVSQWRSEGWSGTSGTGGSAGSRTPRDASGTTPPPGASAGPARQRGGGIGARGAPRIFQRADATPIREMARLHEEQVSTRPRTAPAVEESTATPSTTAPGPTATNPAATASHDAHRIDARVAEDIEEPAQRSR